MKKLTFYLFVSVLCVFANSMQAQIFLKDPFTGLNIDYKGFEINRYYLLDLETGREIRSTVLPARPYKFAIVVSGIKGYKTLSNGNVLPGIDLSITDKATGKVLASAFDIMKQEATPESAADLMASFTTGKPMESGKQYIFKARFYDKNGDGEINTDVVLSIR